MNDTSKKPGRGGKRIPGPGKKLGPAPSGNTEMLLVRVAPEIKKAILTAGGADKHREILREWYIKNLIV